MLGKYTSSHYTSQLQETYKTYFVEAFRTPNIHAFTLKKEVDRLFKQFLISQN